MVVDDLVKNPGCWLSMRQDTGIVISSRVRLARNLCGAAFPGWAGDGECVKLCRRMVSAFETAMPGALVLDMVDMTPLERAVLRERHLISNELAERAAGSALIVSEDEGIAVMINEEDHLRMQAITPGMRLMEIWQRLDAIDSDLERSLDFAFSEEWGYLTACPSNVGTGLRASVMMHLSGLKLTDEIQQVIRGLEKIGLAVRGLLGEGTEAHGDMFQISNQSTLGQSEAEIVQGLIGVVTEVAGHEENARARLFQRRRLFLADQIARALGVLQCARVMASDEATDLLSGMRLGVHFGMIRGLKTRQINEMMLVTQPGHLQKASGGVLGPEERDEARARIMRERFKNVALVV